jgi:hypothetical protein
VGDRVAKSSPVRTSTGTRIQNRLRPRHQVARNAWSDADRQKIIDIKLNFINFVLTERDPGLHDLGVHAVGFKKLR